MGPSYHYVNIYVEYFYGRPGGIGASAAAGGAAAVIGFPAGSGQVPVENGHQENHDADPGQDQRNMPEAGVIHATAEDDARDGRRGDRADIAEGPQEPGRGADLLGRSRPVQGRLVGHVVRS